MEGDYQFRASAFIAPPPQPKNTSKFSIYCQLQYKIKKNKKNQNH